MRNRAHYSGSDSPTRPRPGLPSARVWKTCFKNYSQCVFQASNLSSNVSCGRKQRLFAAVDEGVRIGGEKSVQDPKEKGTNEGGRVLREDGLPWAWKQEGQLESTASCECRDRGRCRRKWGSGVGKAVKVREQQGVGIFFPRKR